MQTEVFLRKQPRVCSIYLFPILSNSCHVGFHFGQFFLNHRYLDLRIFGGDFGKLLGTVGGQVLLLLLVDDLV